MIGGLSALPALMEPLSVNHGEGDFAGVMDDGCGAFFRAAGEGDGHEVGPASGRQFAGQTLPAQRARAVAGRHFHYGLRGDCRMGGRKLHISSNKFSSGFRPPPVGMLARLSVPRQTLTPAAANASQAKRRCPK